MSEEAKFNSEDKHHHPQPNGTNPEKALEFHKLGTLFYGLDLRFLWLGYLIVVTSLCPSYEIPVSVRDPPLKM